MNGISYYASNQWRAAARKPPHLAAICVWEGWNDDYRESARHGGIICSFRKNWQDMQVKTVQHGVGERGAKSRVTGELVCGPETLSPRAAREEPRGHVGRRSCRASWTTTTTASARADLSKVEVPLLSAANWGGQGLHTRGNFEGFMRAASKQKWLEVHGGSHWAPFYTDYGVELQKRFFDHFLKGENNGWDKQPRVLLQVRHPGEKFVQRHENEWPLARTQWTQLLSRSGGACALSRDAAERRREEHHLRPDGRRRDVLHAAARDGRPRSPALRRSSSSSRRRPADADLFVVLRVFDPKGKEVLFQGALDPQTPVGAGLAARLAPQARSEALACRTGRSTRMTRCSRSRRAKWSSSTSRSGRPASSCRRATASRSSIRGKDYEHDECGGDALQHEEPDEGLRAVHPRRRDRPAAGGVRRQGHAALRARSRILLLPIIPEK